MTTRADPVTGNLTGASGSMGGGVPNLTRQQYELAQYNDSIAESLMEAMSDGRPYFTAFHLGQKPIALDPLVDHGIITRHKSTKHDGHYYKATYLTRAWYLTSLALAQERKRLFSERTERGEGR